MAGMSAAERRQLDEHGWCVVPAVIDPSLAEKARFLMDSILGPRGEKVALGVDEGGPGSYLTGKAWPPPDSSVPVVLSADYRHSILHPISSPLMADLTLPLVEINAKLLNCAPT